MDITKIGMTQSTGLVIVRLFFSIIKIWADEFTPFTHLKFKNSPTHTYPKKKKMREYQLK